MPPLFGGFHVKTFIRLGYIYYLFPLPILVIFHFYCNCVCFYCIGIVDISFYSSNS